MLKIFENNVRLVGNYKTVFKTQAQNQFQRFAFYRAGS